MGAVKPVQSVVARVDGALEWFGLNSTDKTSIFQSVNGAEPSFDEL
jgi:hypothetical protein